MYEHDTKTVMISCNDTICNELCNEGINTPIICNDSITRLDKSEWWYLVNTLESWGVFKPRAVVKKNPVAAWKCMNLAKDNYAKSKGAYFMICFKKELAKAEGRALISRLENRLGA